MATKLDIYQEVAALLGNGRVLTTSDDVELVHVLNDLYASAVDYVLTAVPWRFAMAETAAPEDLGAPGLNGYDTGHSFPANMLRMVGAFIVNASARFGELPVDLRMDQGYIYTNLGGGGVKITYISTAGRTEANWPTGFVQSLSAYLAWKASQRITQLNGRAADLLQVYQGTLAAAAERFAVSESPWLSYQLDGSFIRAAHFVLAQGPWRFALTHATLSATMSSGVPSFTYNFDKPADLVRTYAVWDAVASGRSMPIDVRESIEGYSAHIDEIEVVYTTNTVLHTPRVWPEQFLRCVAAHLGINMGDIPVTRSREGGERQEVVWPEYLQRALALEAVPENPWLERQLDGSFLRSVRYVLSQGMWRFAMRSVTLATSATPLPGFPSAFVLPSDHLKTHAIFKIRSDGREIPVDAREHGTVVSSKEASVTVRYLTDAFIHVPANWPDTFLRCVAAHLGINTGDMPAVVRDSEGRASAQPSIWPEYIQQALRDHGLEADRWYPFQISGAFARAVESVGLMAFWRFALTSESLTADGSTTQAVPGYAESFAIPASHLRTRSISALTDSDEHPIDARETGGYWMANVSSIAVQYLDSDLLYDADQWPAEWLDAVWHYMSGTEGWSQFLDRTKQHLAVPPSPWLEHQLDGSFITGVRYLATQQDWRWATVTASLGTAVTTGLVGAWDFKYAVPADCSIITRVFAIDLTGDPYDIAWQQQDGYVHTEDIAENAYADYLSTAQIADVTQWPEYFDTALLAYLNYRAAVSDPGTPGAVLQARKTAFDELSRNAKTRDDFRRRPRVVREPGRFTASRRGYLSGREQG